MQEVETPLVRIRQHILDLHGWSVSRISPLCRRLKRERRLIVRIALLALVATGLVIHAHAQGCAQCLDTTRATPPATQAAYRHAIELLAGAASALFIAGLILF